MWWIATAACRLHFDISERRWQSIRRVRRRQRGQPEIRQLAAQRSGLLTLDLT